MINGFTFTNFRGDSIDVDLRRPEVSGFLIKDVTGLGPAKATINSTEVATYDGSFFNSSRLESRNIIFTIGFVSTETGEMIEDIRQKSYKFFAIKREVTIIVKTDNRWLETTGYVESNEPEIFSQEESAQISIICPDPYFYEAGKDRSLQKTDFYGIKHSFTFPFSNESLTEKKIVLGEIQNMSENTVWYTGDAMTGVYIRIHALGPAKNITIHNTELRQKMTIDTNKIAILTNSTGIITGDDIIITTVKGSKSAYIIRDGVYTNILNALNKDADWFQLEKGDNVFTFVADEGLTNLQFYIENRILYEGV